MTTSLTRMVRYLSQSCDIVDRRYVLITGSSNFEKLLSPMPLQVYSVWLIFEVERNIHKTLQITILCEILGVSIIGVY